MNVVPASTQAVTKLAAMTSGKIHGGPPSVDSSSCPTCAIHRRPNTAGW
jgi:hypothetical protein